MDSEFTNTLVWRQGYRQGRRAVFRNNAATMDARLRAMGLDRLDRSARVLDFGCGDGLLMGRLGEMGFKNVVGMDPDPELWSQTGAFSRVTARGPGLPFADASFDAVVSQSVLHHLPGLDALAAVLAEMARVLRPGGRLFYSEPAQTLLRRLLTPLLLSPLAGLTRFSRQKRLMVLEEKETLDQWLSAERRLALDFLAPAGFKLEAQRRRSLKTFVRAVKSA